MKSLVALVAVMVLIPVLASAQLKASYTPFGKSGLFEPTFNPGITASNPPRLGQKIRVTYTGTYMSTEGYALLLTGTSRSRFGALSLPFTLVPGMFPRTNITPTTRLLVSIDLAQYVGIGTYAPANPLPVSFAIPNDPALLGATFYQQWFLMEFASIPGSYFLRTTCGAAGVIWK